jgi:hypothetical protein
MVVKTFADSVGSVSGFIVATKNNKSVTAWAVMALA